MNPPKPVALCLSECNVLRAPDCFGASVYVKYLSIKFALMDEASRTDLRAVLHRLTRVESDAFLDAAFCATHDDALKDFLHVPEYQLKRTFNVKSLRVCRRDVQDVAEIVYAAVQARLAVRVVALLAGGKPAADAPEFRAQCDSIKDDIVRLATQYSQLLGWTCTDIFVDENKYTSAGLLTRALLPRVLGIARVCRRRDFFRMLLDMCPAYDRDADTLCILQYISHEDKWDEHRVLCTMIEKERRKIHTHVKLQTHMTCDA